MSRKEVDEFVLTEKWYVEVSNELDSKEIQDYFKVNSYQSSTGKWFYTSNKSVKSRKEDIPEGYTEITFEQFTKYVLKQDIMEKEIIGYKFKEDCEKFEEAAVKIVQTKCYDKKANTFKELDNVEVCTFYSGSLSKELLENAGVLNLWFEPVYKEEYPNITINSYKGEFFNDYVKFGCAKIHKNVFIDLNTLNLDLKNGDGIIGMKSNRFIESVTIGKGIFTKEQIKQIAEYYLNKK